MEGARAVSEMLETGFIAALHTPSAALGIDSDQTDTYSAAVAPDDRRWISVPLKIVRCGSTAAPSTRATRSRTAATPMS
jgi:hypothetical protein